MTDNLEKCSWKFQAFIQKLDEQMQKDIQDYTCHNVQEFGEIMNKIEKGQLKNKTILFCEHEEVKE